MPTARWARAKILRYIVCAAWYPGPGPVRYLGDCYRNTITGFPIFICAVAGTVADRPEIWPIPQT
ncbi:hypothetical protein MLPF_2363 [Mycobacterium lepromatosis]|nr:hypothetical protein MLPF_2363 [Mycobacterium lepromatosis]